MSFYNKDILTSKPKLLDGNLQLIASAGSGKTEFVSERIAIQIQKGIAKPEQIVAFTFTEKAAEELKFRVRAKIKELLGHQPDIGDMYIGTIHAFAFKILQDFIPIYRGFDMLDDVGRMAFLSSIKKELNVQYLKNSLQKHFRRPYRRNRENWAFSVFINDLDKFIEEGWNVDEIATSDCFKNAFKVYQEKMKKKRFLDFSSIQRIAVDTLKNNDYILDNIRNQYNYFTVDEYQDVNPIQEELIQLISGKENVCVVGDDDQSIYQWRGADVNNILTFQSRYPDVAVYKLEINRRSHDKIVLSAKDLIEKNTERLDKAIKDKGIKSEAGDLYKLTFNTQPEECQWIAEKINQLVGTEINENGKVRKLEYSDFAILFRSISNQAQPYIDALQNADIPLIYSGTGGLFETNEISSIVQILEYISKVDRGIKYNDDFLKTIHQNLPGIFTLEENKFIKGVKSIEEWARNQKRLSLQGLYGLILELLGVSHPRFHNEENEVLLYNFGRFSTAITDYEESREYITYKGIKSFIWFIRLHAERSYDAGPTDATAHLIDAVQILTMHGTKGLGFPVVFIPGNHKPKANNQPKPSWIDTTKVDISRYDNSEQDERRLFYVGITRAKKFLFISYSRVKIGNIRATRSKPLFDELNDDLFITDNVPDPTKRKPCAVKGVSENALFPTSYSEMAYYLGCGYDYKMRLIYGFNPGIVQALGFGKQVHNVINLLHDEFEKTGSIPTKRKVAEIVEENFYMRYASLDLSERLKLTAFKSIERYVKMWRDDFSLGIKTERPFEMEFNNALISGAIDLIKRENNDGTSLEVIDFKTGKPENDLMEKYELQLQLYTIAAKEALNMDIQNAQVHFWDAAKNQRMLIGTTDHALETASEQINYAINGITNMDFKRDARNDKRCNSCDWKQICPKRDKYKGKN